MDIKEARRLLRQHGGAILAEPAPLALVEALKAHDEELALRPILSRAPTTRRRA
jgi:hypothetical protein